LDSRQKATLRRAAKLRGLSLSDYVRSRIVRAAELDIDDAQSRALSLSRADQLALWRALQNPPAPTRRQKELGARVRVFLR